MPLDDTEAEVMRWFRSISRREKSTVLLCLLIGTPRLTQLVFNRFQKGLFDRTRKLPPAHQQHDEALDDS